MNILAIGAHPDDIELGCGGTLIKSVQNGHTVNLFTLTMGEVGGDPSRRIEESKASKKFIGAENLWIDTLDDSNLQVNKKLIDNIERVIKECKPDLIFTHSLDDTHHDHRAVALATIEAGRFNSNILSYEIPLSQNFLPKVFYNITDVIQDKVELINIFKTQIGKPYLSPTSIKSLAEHRALQNRLGSGYAEGFEVLKLCLDEQFSIRS